MSRSVPGARYAFRLVSFGAPAVRARYPRGVLVGPDGFPDWRLYARAMVRLPDPPGGLTVDEVRVLDVLAANARSARGDDPLWAPGEATPGGATPGEATPGDAVATPAGWTWAHIGLTREVALVPVELHAAYRHAGGMSTLALDRTERGLRVDYEPVPVRPSAAQAVPEEILTRLEEHLRFPLPPRYREFLAYTNGAAPDRPGVLPGFGFVADQRLFGLGRDDEAQDIIGANQYVADRFTDQFLAIGYAQGGTLAVKVRGGDTDSIWYWDDDDPRADEAHDARYIAEHLLYRCADHIGQFFDRLAVPARVLREVANAWCEDGSATEVRPEFVGDSLPAGRRAPWQPEPVSDEEYFANEIVQLAMLRPE